jgi:hypothetical protein
MGDWERFVDDVPWFLKPGQSAVVEPGHAWTRGAVNGLPVLSALLETATVTPVSVGATSYELLAWGSPAARRGWLCHPPHDVDGYRVSRIHQEFWGVCGGIVERFNEPDSWWLNQNEVLTAEATRESVADALTAFAWLWEGAGLHLSINPQDYYAVAVEANANLTLAHRDDGRILLFATDHDFEGVTPLAGSPPCSLLTIDNVPDLTAWIEECAAAWLPS